MEPNLYEKGDRTAVDALLEQMPPMTARVETIEGTPFLISDKRLDVKNQWLCLPRPTRRSGTVGFDAIESFVAYVLSVKTPDTRVYVDADYENNAFSAAAVINDDGADEGNAAWRDHRATFAPKQSVEWKRWLGSNKKAFDQLTFAAFLEDNISSVINEVPNSDYKYPSGGDMLQMALNIEIINDSRVKSSVRLQSGGWEITAVNRENEATQTTMKVFDRFALGLRPFVNMQAYSIEARLRYKTSGAAVNFAYELVRPDLVLETAVANLIKTLQEGRAPVEGSAGPVSIPAIGVPVLFGRCPPVTATGGKS